MPSNKTPVADNHGNQPFIGPHDSGIAPSPDNHGNQPFVTHAISPHDVPLPAAIGDHLSPEQNRKLMQIRIQHAHNVTASLASAYGEIAGLLKPPA